MPKILRIVAGNPLTMKEMVKYVVDAASYAPVTILIEERLDSVRIPYDRMASYLAPYGNSREINGWTLPYCHQKKPCPFRAASNCINPNLRDT